VRSLRVLSLCVAACLLEACAAYLHDARLEGSATKANEALKGVNALQPFDDQLAKLSEFAAREDLTVANYWTSVRDKNVLGLVALPDARRDAQLRSFAAERLEVLLGRGNVTQQNLDQLLHMPGRRELALERQGSYEMRADAFRKTYLERWQLAQQPPKEGKPPKAPDLSCDKALLLTEPQQDDLAAVDPDPRWKPVLKSTLMSLIAECTGAKEQEQQAEAVTKTLRALRSGELYEVAGDAAEIEADTKTKLSDYSGKLQQAIDEAAQYQSASGGLEEFRRRIQSILDQGSEATKLAGWDEVDKAVSQALRTTICEAPEKAVKEETKAEAKCKEIAPTSGAGRAEAAWGVLKALAQLQDANAPQRRSANWLVAAKAVIAAEKADAKLRVEAAQGKAAASRRRLDALIREGAELAAATRWLDRRGAAQSLDCTAGTSVPNRGANRNCAYAAYVTAWNSGRLPAEVLRYKLIQLDREYAVKRARAVATKQYALASAGTATLEEAGKGGIMPATLAQIALDVVSVGAFAGGI